MPGRSRIFFTAISFFFLVCCWNSLHAASISAKAIVMLLLFALTLAELSESYLASWILGVSIFTVPALGNGALYVLFAVSIVTRSLRKPHAHFPVPVLTLLLVSILGSTRSLLVVFDFQILHSIFEFYGFRGVLHSILERYADWRLPVLDVLHWGVVLLFLSQQGEQLSCDHRGKQFQSGLLCGALCCIFAAATQALGWEYSDLIHTNSFWLTTGRVRGLLSDPNAFGVLVAMSLGVFPRNSSGQKLGLGMIAIGALLSGSRTLWIGVVLWALFCVRKRWELRSMNLRRMVFVFAIFVSSIVIVSRPVVNEELQDLLPLPSVQRLLQTIHVEQMERMLWSRSLYSRIALEVWKQEPIFGVGAGRFFSLQVDAARAVGENLGTWRDNANNYYLEILAEEGIVGLILVLSSFVLLSFSLRSSQAALQTPWAQSLFVLSILLLTGPHLRFAEVQLFAACCFRFAAAEDVERDERTYLAWIAGGLILVSVFLLPPKHWTSGFYPREYGKTGSFLWMGARSASFSICPSRMEKEEVLYVKVLHPELDHSPVHLILRSPSGNVYGRKVFRKVGWKKFILHPMEKSDGRQSIDLVLDVDRLWSPGINGAGDKRVFGAMLRWPKDLCRPWHEGITDTNLKRHGESE